MYNTERYIHQCVDSVINQRYQNIEIILVDDGSPDNCPAICDEYAQKDLRVVVIHKENGGLSDARNAGIKASTGDYIMFLDSDDYWVENIDLELMLSTLNSNTDFDFLNFVVTKFYQIENSYNDTATFPEEIFNKNLSKIDKLFLLQERGHFPMSACTKLIRRSLIIDNKLYFRKGYTAEDILWFTELAEVAKDFSVLNKHYYVYRKEVEDSITSNTKTIQSLTKLFFEISDKYKNNNTSYSEYVLGNMAYEYLIILSFVKSFPIEIQEKFKSYSWVLKYDNNKKVKLANRMINLLGYNISSFILRTYISKKNKVKD